MTSEFGLFIPVKALGIQIQETVKMAVNFVVCFICLCSSLVINTVDSKEEHSEANSCNLKVDTGPCLGYFTKWFFNATSNTCANFTYGGCGGNGNNFESKEDCEEECLYRQNENELSSSHSGQKFPDGPCTMALIREKAFLSKIPGFLQHLFHSRSIIPDCDAMGYFKPMQCKHNMKKCKCVDRWGNTVKDSAGKPTHGDPHDLDCSQ